MIRPNNDLKLALLYVGATLNPYGFRKIGGVAKDMLGAVPLFFVMNAYTRSIRNILQLGGQAQLQSRDIVAIADNLALFDILGVAAMSADADVLKAIIARVRQIKPEIYILWGGVHAIYCPEDAMAHADAICFSEGEVAFARFLQARRAGRDISDVPNVWYRHNDRIVKNPAIPLLTNSELSTLPFLSYGDDDYLYDRQQRFRPVALGDYLDSEAMAFKTVWTRGCPFKCTFCANSRLLKLDKGYGKVRYPSVPYLVGEIGSVLKKFPYIQVIQFNDDCFMDVPLSVLHEFTDLWQQHVKRTIVISGLTPVHVNLEKLQLLQKAGLNRVRMGIQSGSEKVLKFFKRPNRPGLIREATDIVSGLARGGAMIPPAYDLIVDIPVETAADVQATLRMVNDLKRPFTINFHSLRAIPNTELVEQLEQLEHKISHIENNYEKLAPTLANSLLLLSGTVRLPEWLLCRLLPHCKPFYEDKQTYGGLMQLCRILFLAKRLYDHLRCLDFSVVLGRIGWRFWSLGLLKH
ncbi:MAG: B12-binding domain-containing radical SAM protein [Magnetococcales bacterium]|nr:B12-binding domain-containing radical SAM protein [Magnetococcales bacterium]